MTRINAMSKNIVNAMNRLSMDDSIKRLLINDGSAPYDVDLPKDFTNNIQIIKQSDKYCRILPFPFDPNATVDDRSFIRIYYNDADFDSGLISESLLHVDVIVAKSLWLIKGFDGKESIRPYELVESVMDAIGRRNGDPTVQFDFTGMRHLSVNTKYDAIRLYAEYFKPEV